MARKGHPQKAAIIDAVAKQLAEDGKVSTTEIALNAGIPRRTVRSIIERNQEIIQNRIKLKAPELLANWRYAHQSTLADYLAKDQEGVLSPIDRYRLTLSMGIATDKITHLLGLPTARVAITSADDVPEREQIAVSSRNLLRMVKGETA
jgi:hypothetical protein